MLYIKISESNNLTYYQRNKDMILSKAKDYYKSNNERLKRHAKDKYRNLSEENRNKKREIFIKFSFTPTPKHNIFGLETDIYNFVRKQRLIYHFHD